MLQDDTTTSDAEPMPDLPGISLHLHETVARGTQTDDEFPKFPGVLSQDIDKPGEYYTSMFILCIKIYIGTQNLYILTIKNIITSAKMQVIQTFICAQYLSIQR